MKRLIVTHIFLILVMFTFGQSITSLDSNNGFKDFKLGDPKSKWINSITKRWQSSIPNTYNYIGDCCKSAFGQNVASIGLIFDSNDMLVEIIVNMSDRYQGVEHQQFINTIKSSFGRQTATSTDDRTGNITLEWAGEKVVLAMLSIYKGADEGGWEVSLLFIKESYTINPSKDF